MNQPNHVNMEIQRRADELGSRIGEDKRTRRYSARIRDAVSSRFRPNGVPRLAVRQRETTASPCNNRAPAFGDFEDGDWLLVAVDIIGYGSRPGHLQNYIRQAMYALVRQACDDSAVPWPAQQRRQDHGDGLLMALSYKATQRVVELFVPYLYAGLRRHNEVSADTTKIELRMAVHAGFVIRDDYALTGEAIVHLHRLLDAPAFRHAVARRRATLGVVASRRIYDDIIRPGRGLIDPDQYGRLLVANKETTAEAWVHMRYRRFEDFMDLARTA